MFDDYCTSVQVGGYFLVGTARWGISRWVLPCGIFPGSYWQVGIAMWGISRWVLPCGVFQGGYCHVGYFQADIARWAFVGGWVGLTIGGKACLLQLDSRKTFLRFAYICSCSHHAHHLHHQHHHWYHYQRHLHSFWGQDIVQPRDALHLQNG